MTARISSEIYGVTHLFPAFGSSPMVHDLLDGLIHQKEGPGLRIGLVDRPCQMQVGGIAVEQEGTRRT